MPGFLFKKMLAIVLECRIVGTVERQTVKQDNTNEQRKPLSKACPMGEKALREQRSSCRIPCRRQTAIGI